MKKILGCNPLDTYAIAAGQTAELSVCHRKRKNVLPGVNTLSLKAPTVKFTIFPSCGNITASSPDGMAAAFRRLPSILFM